MLFIKQFRQWDYLLVDNIVNVISLYGVPLSIIVTAVSLRQSPDAKVTGTTLTLLFGSTVIWNGLVIGTLAYYDWATFYATPKLMHFPDKLAGDFLASVPGKLTFLVSGGLTYFFVGNTPKSGAGGESPGGADSKAIA